jgi:hypothetical protein
VTTQEQAERYQKLDTVIVGIETHLGAHYTFPDMERGELQRILPKMNDRVPSGSESLCLVNMSLAALAIPFRIIKRVTVDTEEWWISPMA